MVLLMTHGRNILCASLSLTLSSSCTSETVNPPPKPPVGSLEPVAPEEAHADTVTEKERALPELYASALRSVPNGSSAASGRAVAFAGLTALLNPDLAEFSSPIVALAHDVSGIVAAHEALFGAFDNRKVTLTRVWRTPSEQSLEWIMSGTQARAWMGIPPTQRSITFSGLTLLWTKDDGTILDMHVYFDAGLVQAILSGSGSTSAAPPYAAVAAAPQVFDPVRTTAATGAGPVELVKAWLQALEDGKEAAYAGSLADSVEIQTLERTSPLRGRDEARKYFRDVRGAVGQLDTTVNNAWTVGDYVVVEYGIDGEQIGPVKWIPLLATQPVPATQLVHFDIVDICQVEDAHISKVWRYDDPSQLLGRKGLAAASEAVGHEGHGEGR
jgi:hypothetical protein